MTAVSWDQLIVELGAANCCQSIVATSTRKPYLLSIFSSTLNMFYVCPKSSRLRSHFHRVCKQTRNALIYGAGGFLCLFIIPNILRLPPPHHQLFTGLSSFRFLCRLSLCTLSFDPIIFHLFKTIFV